MRVDRFFSALQKGAGGQAGARAACRRPFFIALSCALAFAALTMMPEKARALCTNCACPPIAHGIPILPPPGYTISIPGNRFDIRGVVRDEHQITTDHILEEFEDQEEFLLDVGDPLNEETIFGRFIHPALMMMTEQMVHTAMEQALIIGTLLDAKQQLESQLLFQQLIAEAHKDYQPSHNMCVLGTNIRSLAEAERNYEYSTYVLSQRSIDRQMGNMLSIGARGQYDDTCFRLKQFRSRYCNLRDNNDRMIWICDPEAAFQATQNGGGIIGGIINFFNGGGGNTLSVIHPECLADEIDITADSKNKDIDFTRTIDRANTLEIDFYTPGQVLSEDEEDIFALGSNLYSSELMYRVPELALKHRVAQDSLLDMRTIIAKRSVAEHSYNTIAGMKSLSKEDATLLTYPYMQLILETMGLGVGGTFDAEELAIYLGERPSYYAQMELLTKLIFQNPDFFTNLYDEPANIERQGVALQAIGLMQDFDTWQSYLRTEAMLSVVLELEILKLNSSIQNQMGNMRSGGPTL